MKVTLIGTLPPIKGISPYCMELLKSISQKAEVEFIGFKKLYPDFLYPGGTAVADKSYSIPYSKGAEIRNILSYYNPFSWIWAGITAKGDVIHAQWWSPVLAPVFFTIMVICKARKKKIVLTLHNIQPHEKSMITNFLNKSILTLGDAYIVHSYKNKETLSKAHGISQDDVSVIPHGILRPSPLNGVSTKDARAYLDIPLNRKVLLYFGNIRPYKGLDILLRALAYVKDDVDDVTLIIAGEPWTDWADYERIIEENGLDPYIIKRLGFVPPEEVEYYFLASDVVVLPYKYFESQSGVGALALPLKKPLIVTNVGGLTDFIKDRRAVAKPNDVMDLADRIILALKDDNLIHKLSLDSEDLASKYDWDNITEKTVELYEMVSHGR